MTLWSALTTLTGAQVNPATDEIVIKDTSDTTLDPTGTPKRIKITDLFTVTGALERGGVAGGQTAHGGQNASDRLILKATTNPAPTGSGIGFFGSTTETMRLRADGKLTVGNVGFSAAANAQEVVAAGTPSPIGSFAGGTALGVVHGFDAPGLGANPQSVLIDSYFPPTGMSTVQGIEASGMNVMVRNNNPSLTTQGNGPNLCGINPRVFQLVTYAGSPTTQRPTLFAMNPQVIIGSGDTGNAADQNITNTNHTILQCIEASASDLSAHIAPNGGNVIRLLCRGVNDVYHGLLINCETSSPPVFLNGVYIDDSPKNYTEPAWQTGHAYLVGDLVNNGGVYFQAKVAHTSTTGGAHPIPTGSGNTDWKLANQRNGPRDWAFYFGPSSSGLPTGQIKAGILASDGSFVTQGGSASGYYFGAVGVGTNIAVYAGTAAQRTVTAARSGSLWLQSDGTPTGQMWQRVDDVWTRIT